MVPLKYFNKTEKEKLLRQLNEQFGIEEIPGQIAKFGKERIILFSKEISEKDIQVLDKTSRIEGIGVYFAKVDEDNNEIRLSIEGTQLLKNQITKNIFELEEKQAEQWMMGQEILLDDIKTFPEGGRGGIKKGFFIIKFKDDFLGTGKISENKISNFVPKSRRLKYKENKIEELK